MPYFFKNALVFALLLCVFTSKSQSFYFGADLSYVNQMEDCGVAYKAQNQVKDVYELFAERHCNLVRLRLWHTPAWYDTLNAGKRYADFQDVRKSIVRAKAQGMQVLLDFHLSDTWADPGRQLVPKAWEGVVDNLPLLKDSVYNYISKTLLSLNEEGLLPEMVQIGNETNRGILLSPAVDAAGWSLDWNRNSQLFNRAIQAVRDVENQCGKNIQIALHIAGPSNAGWLMEGFWAHGVTDFDVIGLSYYWAWHKPTSMADVGNLIAQLRQQYQGKSVMILETSYLWTTQWNDNASNILNEVHPDYAPASPENQRKWLTDLTQEVILHGGKGVICWEPAWQSSPCWTAWGQGSHLEHATFFDFQNNLHTGGGIDFMAHPYQQISALEEEVSLSGLRIWADVDQRSLTFQLGEGVELTGHIVLQLFDVNGRLLASKEYADGTGARLKLSIPLLPRGLYYGVVKAGNVLKARGSLILS